MMTNEISVLFEAAELGDSNKVEIILCGKPELSNEENEHGLTLLGIAAHYGKVDVVKTLIQYGANINAISHSKLPFIPKNTALHAGIAGAKSMEIIDYLLTNGADCNLVDSEGHTPLHIAAFEGNIHIAKRLVEYGAKQIVNKSEKTPIQIAEEQNHIEFVQFLKEAAKVN